MLNNDKNYVLINADKILRSMHGDWHSDLDNLKAMRVAVTKLKQELLSGHNVIQETTLASSRKGILKFINFAKNRGYTVRLEYVGLVSAKLAVNRVKLRVSKGGHGVKPDLVTRRYTRSL
ncbi:MAG: zeta toxin family protein [Limosilactobacillus sp.]|nr:zeta toxin family protein [Limosilactobacillus sp.]